MQPPRQQPIWDCGSHREVAQADTGKAVAVKEAEAFGLEPEFPEASARNTKMKGREK